MPKDGFIDLMIHFEDGRYVLYLEKTAGGLVWVELQAEELISLIGQSLQQAGYTDKTIPLRFLSCSDKEAAKQIALGLDHPMYVTDGLVRIHRGALRQSLVRAMRLRNGIAWSSTRIK